MNDEENKGLSISFGGMPIFLDDPAKQPHNTIDSVTGAAIYSEEDFEKNQMLKYTFLYKNLFNVTMDIPKGINIPKEELDIFYNLIKNVNIGHKLSFNIIFQDILNVTDNSLLTYPICLQLMDYRLIIPKITISLFTKRNDIHTQHEYINCKLTRIEDILLLVDKLENLNFVCFFESDQHNIHVVRSGKKMTTKYSTPVLGQYPEWND